MCRQPLQVEPSELEGAKDGPTLETCSGASSTGALTSRTRNFECASEIVPILKQMMTRRGKSVADLSSALRWHEDETSQMLNLLQNKGLVQQSQKENKVVFTANMK